MKNVYIHIFILLLIQGMISNSLSQIELESFDHYLTYQDKVIDQVLGTSESNKIVSATLFLRDFKSKSNNFLGKLVLSSNEQNFPFKTRGINNVSDMYKENSKSIVLLVQPDYSSMGAGCIITEDGLILTNYHVIENADKMLTFFYDKNITKIDDINSENFKVASVIAAIPEIDLALLKLSTNKEQKALRFGDNSSIEVAQDVFAIGHPESYIWSFTSGVISQLRNNYEWAYDSRTNCKANVIQTQTPINPGNSGGPLFNDQGELIGINSFRTEGAEGLNFAIRLNEIQKFLREVEEGKHKYELIASHHRRTEEIYWDQLDTDDNGIIDSEAADLDGNGMYDIVKVDENEDGNTDYIVMDTNQDNTIDVYIYDRDRDGHFEYYLIDTNSDGYLDTIGIDTNKDGSPNEFFDYVE